MAEHTCRECATCGLPWPQHVANDRCRANLLRRAIVSIQTDRRTLIECHSVLATAPDGMIKPVEGTLDPDVHDLREEFDALLDGLSRWWCEMTGHKEFPKS